MSHEQTDTRASISAGMVTLFIVLILALIAAVFLMMPKPAAPTGGGQAVAPTAPAPKVPGGGAIPTLEVPSADDGDVGVSPVPAQGER